MTDELGTCPTCDAPLVRQTDRRKAAGFSIRCSVGGHSRPSTAGTPRRGPRAPAGTRRPSKARAARRIGTQAWLTDHSVPACAAPSCYWDTPCPVHGSRRFAYEPEPVERAGEPNPEELDGILY